MGHSLDRAARRLVVVLGSAADRNRVMHTFTFPPFTSSLVRVSVTRALGGYFHIT